MKKRKSTRTEVVLSALQHVFRLRKPPTIRRDIRAFFGKMTLKEYEEFQKSNRDFSAVDAEMWK